MKAIYAGSFDPFTNGHLDILKQASSLFDEIIIIVTDNTEKKRNYNIEFMISAINKELYDNNIKNVSVVRYLGLIADYAKQINIKYLIRGLRNPNDYQYEENIAKINKELNPELHTIYFRTDNEVISSSMVRELYKYNKDISKYVSGFVLEVIKNG